MTAVVILAHQGGWDEMLMVLGPIALMAGLLRLAKKRVDANQATGSGTHTATDAATHTAYDATTGGAEGTHAADELTPPVEGPTKPA